MDFSLNILDTLSDCRDFMGGVTQLSFLKYLHHFPLLKLTCFFLRHFSQPYHIFKKDDMKQKLGSYLYSLIESFPVKDLLR